MQNEYGSRNRTDAEIQRVNTQIADNALRFMNEKKQFVDMFAFDSFNRADSTTTLGSPETSIQTTQTYNALIGTWGISGNKAYRVNGGLGLALLNYGINNCVLESNLTVGSQCGIAFRVLDAQNYLYIRMESDSVRLYKSVADVSTVIGSYYKVSGTFVDINLKVVLNDGNIKVFVDGVLVINEVDTFNLNQTLHGLYARMVDGSRFKTFSISSLRYINNLQIKENFEGTTLPWYWTAESPAQSYSQNFSTNYAREGAKSMRFEIHDTDPIVSGSKRCEIKAPVEYPMEEHWYCVSILLPNGGDEDYVLDPTSEEIITQWHDNPDAGEGIFPPPLALATTGSGRYSMTRIWDDARITTNTANLISKGYKVSHDLGSYIEDKGKWVDWMFHVRWGWLSSQNPILEVYKNGKLVLNQNGLPNMKNDASGVFWKMGIYKYDWKDNPGLSTINKRVAYYDKVTIV